MPEYVFVDCNFSWADEINVETRWITNAENWAKWQSAVLELPDEQEIYYGSNEFITVERIQDVIDDCRVSPISEEEVRVIAKWFGGDPDDKDGLEVGQIGVFSILADKASDQKKYGKKKT